MISIIVPVYNAEKYIRRCINSIINQTYTNFELILIDDGSSDKSSNICDEYAACDGRIKVIHTENKGVSSARNTGLNVANGAYIGFVDSDDWLESDMYEFLLENAENYKADISCCNYYVNGDKETIIEHQQIESIVSYNEGCTESFLERKTFGNNIWNKIFKKSVIKEGFNVDLSIGEDAYFLFKVCLNSKSIVCCKEAKYHYFIRMGSATKTGFNPKVFQSLVFTDMIIDDVKNKAPKSVDKAYAYGYMSYFNVLNAIIYHKMESKYPMQYEKIVSFLNSEMKRVKPEKSISKLKLYATCLFNINKGLYRLLIRIYYKKKKADFLN